MMNEQKMEEFATMVQGTLTEYIEKAAALGISPDKALETLHEVTSPNKANVVNGATLFRVIQAVEPLLLGIAKDPLCPSESAEVFRKIYEIKGQITPDGENAPEKIREILLVSKQVTSLLLALEAKTPDDASVEDIRSKCPTMEDLHAWFATLQEDSPSKGPAKDASQACREAEERLNELSKAWRQRHGTID